MATIIDGMFRFQPRDTPMDWSVAKHAGTACVDVRAVRSNTANVVQGQLEAARGDVNAPPGLVAAFDALQLGAQYVLHCTDTIVRSSSVTEARCNAVAAVLAAKRREYRKARAACRALYAEAATLDAQTEAYARMLEAPVPQAISPAPAATSWCKTTRSATTATYKIMTTAVPTACS